MKFYAKVETEFGDMILTVKAKSKQNARERLFKNYNIESIIEISTKPIRIKAEIPTLSSIHASGLINQYATTTKRYNAWGY